MRAARESLCENFIPRTTFRARGGGGGRRGIALGIQPRALHSLRFSFRVLGDIDGDNGTISPAPRERPK